MDEKKDGVSEEHHMNVKSEKLDHDSSTDSMTTKERSPYVDSLKGQIIQLHKTASSRATQ